MDDYEMIEIIYNNFKILFPEIKEDLLKNGLISSFNDIDKIYKERRKKSLEYQEWYIRTHD